MYRKKGRSWTKHIDFMLLDVLCMQIAFIVSYICRFGLNNPYIDKDYRILAVAFLLIDFFVEIVSDAFKNVLKRGYLDEFIVTCKHVALVEIITTFFLFTTQMGEIYSRMSYYIMIPIYILVSYLGRMVLKKIIKKRGFASSKESLFVIAPEKLLRETLQGLKENGFGYTQIVAAATDADLNGKTICEIPIVANHDGIVDYACEEWVDEVLIPPCAESEYPYEMADIFLEMGIAVHRGITKNKVMAGSFNQIEKIGDYTVITASLNYARTTQLGMHDYLGTEAEGKCNRDGKIIVIGQSEVGKDKLAAVAKKMGIAKDRFEFLLDYKDAKTFDFRKTQWSSKYSYILVGPMPHSGVAKGEYSSIISAIESEAGYPPVVKMGTDGLKITKTSFRNTLEYLLTEKNIA
ncbi:hypothetical protein [Agathobacter rectalis]|uniref:hypothetical protein n=1 Tax=Agathobacter rectalis TaxID=39491 RepID=UPI0027D23C8D|nr:hypothetical protein [Agathobacter rectalis]